MNLVFSLVFSILWVFESHSNGVIGIYTSQGQSTSLESVVAAVKPGTVVLLGEKHYQAQAQKDQMAVLSALRSRGLRVSVGMEFISYPDQDQTDRFLNGQLDDQQFLTAVGFSKEGFKFYKDQILFPRPIEGEKTLAINAPRQLTSRVSKVGLKGLSESELALLPPDFALGRSSYLSRFSAAMNHALTPDALERYFAAQSIWDDTMAWQIAEFFKSNPQQVLVVIVGEFHTQYGGGLPDRLRARGIRSQVSLSQFDHRDFSTEEEIVAEVLPHSTFGPRADFIWIF